MPVIDVAIVGGGIAGLSAAYELHRRGVAFLLCEGSSRAGGVILSEDVDGFTIDAGPDSLLVQKPEGINLCREIGLGDRLVSTRPPRLAYIQRRGRLYALPAGSILGIPTEIGPFVTTRLFSWLGKLRMGAELMVPPRTEASDESIGSFMTRRFGHEAARYLAEPLLAGIHAGDVDRLSVGALFPRFVEAERRHGSLMRAFRHQRRHRAQTGGTAEGREEGAFKSLPGGLSELVAALLRVLPAERVRLNARVARLSGEGPFQLDVGAERVQARAVVLATPAFVTAALVRERDAELARLCDEVPYASTATVVLAFRRERVAHPLNGSGFVVPRVEGVPILAASWLSSKWPHRAPEGFVLMRTFHGGARDPKALELSDADLVRTSLAAVGPLLGITGEPLFARVYRWERANAQHEVGHLERIASIERALARHPGLHVTGSGFRGVGIPDCVADGRAVARRLAEWLERSDAGHEGTKTRSHS